MDYQHLTDDEKRSIAEARLRHMEREHFERSLDLEAARERGDDDAVAVVAEDLAQREATIERARVVADKVAPVAEPVAEELTVKR